MSRLLERLLDADPPPFAVLHRPESGAAGSVDVLVGDVTTPERLADVALPATPVPGRHEALVVLPFRQVRERGYRCVDDSAPLLALTVADQESVPVDTLLDLVADEPITLGRGRFSPDDDEYADIVRRVVRDEIGAGEGANFVIRRSYLARIEGFAPRQALTLMRRLLLGESGAYWTFVVHTGEHTFVGASPERHVSLHEGTAVMNPISGTYRYPSAGPSLPELIEFLSDTKETDELFMVVDEELKMMSRICERGARVVGPYLKEMARLAHTEYLIEGECSRDPREILRESLFAPTVTGSPLESACGVIERHETTGRGYYSGVLGLIGRDVRGAAELDSAIMIRTADIDPAGEMTIGVGATLVRHSDPVSEVAETAAKAAGLLSALGTGRPARFREHPEICGALRRRNDRLADFWLTGATDLDARELAGRRVLVVDAEDTFTSMIAHQLAAVGLAVQVSRFDEPHDLDAHDVVVLGPGPGDPRAGDHPKIAHLRACVEHLIDRDRPFLAVCLSHQVVSDRLGFPLHRRDVPSQGEQREIDLFGTKEHVGFYNTFAALAADDVVDCGPLGPVEVSRDPFTGEVHALRGRRFASMQFHAESVLTRGGLRITTERLKEVLAP